LVIGCWLLVVGYWLPALSVVEVLVIGCWLLVACTERSRSVG